MTPAAWRRLVVTTVVLVEVYFFVRYAQGGALFHFWLHALLGGALGVGLLVLARLLRPARGRRLRTPEAGLTGHLYSAVPDVLFLVTGALHVAWMDVFVLHITAHFLWPTPLLAGLALWAVVVVAWVAERLGSRRAAAGALLGATAFLAVAVVLRAPLPSTLQEVVDRGSNGSLDQAASWVCRVEV